MVVVDLHSTGPYHRDGQLLSPRHRQLLACSRNGDVCWAETPSVHYGVM